MPASYKPVYWTRENSTWSGGVGSNMESVNTGLVNGTVALSLPACATGSARYSSPIPTQGGTMDTTLYDPSVYSLSTLPVNSKGWFLDDTSLAGFRLEQGMTCTGTLNFENWSGIYDANLYLRFFKFNTTTGQFTYLSGTYDVSTTFRNNNDASFSSQIARSTTFTATDRLYIDMVWYYPDGGCTARTVTMRTGDGSFLNVPIIPNSDLAPANDNLANATAIAPATGVYSGTFTAANHYSSYETGETQNTPSMKFNGLQAYDGPGSMWWKWTCPTSGDVPTTVWFDTHNSRSNTFYDGDSSSPYYGQDMTLDTNLRVYTSSTPSAPTYASLTLISENDDWDRSTFGFGPWGDGPWQADPGVWSRARINNPVPGQTYFFQVTTQTRQTNLSAPGESNYMGQVAGSLRFNWRYTYRGPWTEQPNISNLDNEVSGIAGGPFTDTNQLSVNQYDWYKYLNEARTNYYFPQFMRWAGMYGYWAIWQSFGSPDPGTIPDAYLCATRHASYGDQSNNDPNGGIGGGPDQGGWTDSTRWADPNPRDGLYCQILGAYRPNPNDVANVGHYSTGGYVTYSAPGVLSGSMLEIMSNWKVHIHSPWVPAMDHRNYSYLNNLDTYLFPLHDAYGEWVSNLPTGVWGVVYENDKHSCDIVHYRVRPSTTGTQANSNHGVHIEWWMPDTASRVGQASSYGPWETADVVATGSANGSMGGAVRWRCAPHYPSEIRLYTSIGSATWAGGVQSFRTTTWHQLLQYEDVPTVEDLVFERTQHEFFFAQMADYIIDMDTIGFQGPPLSYSFTRRVTGHTLEHDLELRRPRYALLYTVPQNPVDPPPPEWPVELTPPPLRQKQRDDDNGLVTDGSMTPRLAGTGASARPTSEQRQATPRLQTRNFKGYR